MARGRMIDRKIATSRKISACTRTEQWFYFRIMPFVDDEGRLPGDLFELKNLCFPAEKLTEGESLKILSKLHDVGLVLFAEDYVIELVGFMNHQKIGHRPAKSLFPEYQEVAGKGGERSARFAKAKPALTSLKLDSIKSFRKIQHLKLSEDEYKKLVTEYGEGRVEQILESMQNYAKLKNYTSAYLTARKWLKREDEKKPSAQQLTPQPQKNSYYCDTCNTGFSSKDGKCPNCGGEGL
jgi:rubrerythrin